MAVSSNSLGYIVVDGAEGLFRGSSLVVDFRGIPMDFRYTDPIRPTRLERILYGSALEVYLREELILESLLGAVEARPSLWICRVADLLAPLKSVTRGKVLFLAPSSRSPMEAAGSVESAGENGAVYMVQADSVSAPLRVAFPDNVREDEVRQVVGLLVEFMAIEEQPCLSEYITVLLTAIYEQDFPNDMRVAFIVACAPV
ncbi:MAG: hypothetical protein LBJ22_04725, partial [Synergistaceae bacterium]|nr:hypothetical protein [Synergistaceae bacterium]